MNSLLDLVDIDEIDNGNSEINLYIEQMGEIQKKCYYTVSQEFSENLSEESIRALTTSLFIQTCKKFSL